MLDGLERIIAYLMQYLLIAETSPLQDPCTGHTKHLTHVPKE